MSGRVDLGGERRDNSANRAAGGTAQAQATMMHHQGGPAYAQPGMYDFPSHLAPTASASISSSSNPSRPPLEAAPQYYQAFNASIPPQYSQHQPAFYLPQHQQQLGALPSPPFQQQPQLQSLSRPSSSGDSNYSNGKIPSPPLPSAAYYQQHRHSYPNVSYPALHTPNSLPSTPALPNLSRPSTSGGAGSSSSSMFSLNPHSTISSSMPTPSSAQPPPAAAASIEAILQRASISRSTYHSGDPVLAYNPAREPSAPTKAIVHRGGVKYAVGTTSLNGKGANGGVVVGTGKAKLAELQASCYACGTVTAKLILRGNDVEFGPRAEFTCLACLPADAVTAATDVGDIEDQQYTDTLSAAVDRLEGLTVRTARIVTPEQTIKQLPASHKSTGMACGYLSPSARLHR